MKTKIILAFIFLFTSACSQDGNKTSDLDLKIKCDEPKIEAQEMPLVENDPTFWKCDEADYLDYCTVQKQATRIDFDRYDAVTIEPIKTEVINFKNEQLNYTPFGIKDVPKRLYPTLSQIVLQTKNISDERVIEEIKKAIHYWNSALGKELFVIDNNKEIHVAFCMRKSLIMPKSDNSGYFGAFTNVRFENDKFQCKIDVGESTKYMWTMYVHELGHCLDLSHSDDVNSIMYHSLNTDQYISQKSIDMVKDLLKI